MITNLEKYKKDLDRLIEQGKNLFNGIQAEFLPEEFREQVQTVLKDKKQVKEFIGKLPSFKEDYQKWYSEGLILLRQLLPDRLSDFIRLYE